MRREGGQMCVVLLVVWGQGELQRALLGVDIEWKVQNR